MGQRIKVSKDIFFHQLLDGHVVATDHSNLVGYPYSLSNWESWKWAFDVQGSGSVSRGSAVTYLADNSGSFLPHIQGRRRRCRRYHTFDDDHCFRSIVSRLQPREVIRIRIRLSHLSIVCSMLSWVLAFSLFCSSIFAFELLLWWNPRNISTFVKLAFWTGERHLSSAGMSIVL